MAKYVPDIMTRRWVIIASQRLKRPSSFDEPPKTGDVCPFCPGNEKLTPSEVMRVGSGEKDGPGWEVRVFPNKFPITDIHELIVHSPFHDKDIEDVGVEQGKKLFTAFRERFNHYRHTGQVLIFSNHGEGSGASLKHPHSQLVVIPFQINLDTLTREPISNLVEVNDHFNIYCPDFSQWPYEVWIAPKKEGVMFGDITDEEIFDLVTIFEKMAKRLRLIHDRGLISRERFGYNFYIHPKENWYLRLIPRFVHRAGFELGTGLSVNVVDPTQAAEELRETHLV